MILKKWLKNYIEPTEVESISYNVDKIEYEFLSLKANDDDEMLIRYHRILELKNMHQFEEYPIAFVVEKHLYRKAEELYKEQFDKYNEIIDAAKSSSDAVSYIKNVIGE